jgi:S1-C subfamily serine protease
MDYMKSRDIPTSPRHRTHPEEIDALYKMEPTIMKPYRRGGLFIVGVIILSVCVTLGVIIALRFGADRYTTIGILKYFRSSTSTTERVVLQPSSSAQKTALNDIISAVTPSLGAIVKSSSTSVRQLDDKIGNAVFISNDGAAFTMTGTTTLGTTSLVRLTDGVEQVIHDPQTDPATSAAFIRLNISTTPVTFADSDQVALGDTVLLFRYNAYAGGVEYMSSSIMGTHERSSIAANGESLVESSEVLTRQLRVSGTFDASWVGAGVFNEKGHLIGIISSTNETQGAYVIPINVLKNLVTKYVAGETLQRAVLGVHYINLSYHSTIASYPSKGALLFSNDKKVPAVTSKSPGSIAGLMANDVITSVDATPLNELRSLSDALATYAPNSKVDLTVLRNNKETKISVTLGAQPEKN